MKQVSMWSHVERKCIHFVSKCILIDGITNYHFRKYWSKNIFQTWNHHVTFCHIDVEKYHSDIFPKYQSINILNKPPRYWFQGLLFHQLWLALLGCLHDHNSHSLPEKTSKTPRLSAMPNLLSGTFCMVDAKVGFMEGTSWKKLQRELYNIAQLFFQILLWTIDIYRYIYIHSIYI